MESLDKHIGVFGKIMELTSKYGWIKTVFTGLIYAAVIYFVTSVAVGGSMDLFNKNSKIEERKSHDDAMVKRMEAAPKINNILVSLLRDFDCDRAFVMEMHNGTNNASGLPFIYAEMTYSQCAEGTEYVDDDYTSVNLSRFTLPYYLIRNGEWVGSVDSLNDVDGKIAMRMKSNQANYIGIVLLQGIEKEIGFLGISYCDTLSKKNDADIRRHLHFSAQKVSSLLDKEHIR